MLIKLRCAFQLGTLLVFIFQMYTAITKFLSFPVMHQISETELSKVPPLKFYVCSQKPFNYRAAHKMGYEWQEDFLQGMISNTTGSLSWKGKFNSFVTYSLV